MQKICKDGVVKNTHITHNKSLVVSCKNCSFGVPKRLAIVFLILDEWIAFVHICHFESNFS